MKREVIVLGLFMSFLFVSNPVDAQMFEGSARWDDDDESTLIVGKWSQLFYEVNVGWNVSDFEHYANFLYFGIGVGHPVNTKNAWRKFLPKQQIPSNEEEAELFGSMNTDDVYGGKVGMGWIHYFNHSIGFYTQVSWGFLADFGSPADDDVSTTTSSNTKKTFIYNTVPVELGLCINCWKHLHLQCGATYMWKEIPLVTVGVGYAF